MAGSLESIQAIQGNSPNGARYQIMIDGKQHEVTQQEVDVMHMSAQAAFAKAVQKTLHRSADALNAYNIFRKTMTEGVVDGAIMWLFDSFAVDDPGEELKTHCAVANNQAPAALAAAKGGSYVSAANFLITADSSAHRAHALIVAYKEGIEDAGETTVTFLEGVKTASEITLAVGGAVVTGGGSVALAGGVGIVVAEDLIGPALAGEKIDWGQLAFDVALEIAMDKLAPGERVEKAVLERLGMKAVEKVGIKAAKQAFAKVLKVSAAAIFKQSVRTAQQALSGKKVSADQFVEATNEEYLNQFVIEVAKELVKK